MADTQKMDEVTHPRLGLAIWATVASAAALWVLAEAVIDLHHDFGIGRKDHLFHLAGALELTGAVALVAVAVAVCLERHRPERRRLILTVACALFVLALGTVIAGLALSDHAWSICACENV